MILVNPGEPGYPGVDFLLTSVQFILVPTISIKFDIISFNPRGLGHSIPSANCSTASTTSKMGRRDFGSLPQEYWNTTFEGAKELGAECEATIGGLEQQGNTCLPLLSRGIC